MKLFVLAIVIEVIVLAWMYYNQKPKKKASTQDDTSPQDGAVDPDACWEMADALPIITTGSTFILVDAVWGLVLLILNMLFC